MEKEKRDLKHERITVKPGFCPKCGAYVGAFYSCTECHSKMPHGTRLRVSQISVFISVIIGIFILAVYAQIDPAPKVNIGDINQTYSNGIVTIEGKITNIDYYVSEDESWRMLTFTVEDKTGSIDVKAYTETIEELINDKNTPAIGDKCTIRGSVYIKGEDLYLILDSSQYLDISRTIKYELQATELLSLYQADTEKYDGTRVKVTGFVSWIGEDNTYFDLDSSVRVYFPDYVREFAPGESISVVVGDEVEVVGLVDSYFDIVEVLPGSMYDFKITSYGGAQE